MKLRLNTVRAKLTALVALSGLVTLASLPLLSWIMSRQLVDQVNDRVPAAIHAFGLELNDDMRDLSTIVEQLASQPEVVGALRDRDGAQLAELGKIFHTAYPQIDFVFFGSDDAQISAIEVDEPWKSAHDVPELAALGAEQLRTVTAKGCESADDAVPAFISAKRVPGAGLILACLPLDVDYLNEVQEKLGGEVAFFGPGGTSIGATKRFPIAHLAEAGPKPKMVESDGEQWAFESVTPPAMSSKSGAYGMVLALDVTDIKGIVRKHLWMAVAVLAFATLVSVGLGTRLASVMSRALSRISGALRRLEQHEYVHVEPIRSGDEIEDLANGFNAMVDGLKERDKLRSTFGKYMTQTVVEHLMSGKVQLGGETLTVTILFTDIRSFTTISEQMNDAQALVALLNEYFTEMVGVVMEEDGVVDKYIGDAIMAVFGAPVEKPDDAVRAVRAAVRMRHALDVLNERLKARGVAPLRTGIGIHTGEVVAGNIGSEARMEYTVIGDAVNLASRLESSTKELGVDVLISADTYALVKDTVKAKPIREITVKGRAEPVMTYEVTGLVDPS